jgi:hypothetical protein
MHCTALSPQPTRHTRGTTTRVSHRTTAPPTFPVHSRVCESIYFNEQPSILIQSCTRIQPSRVCVHFRACCIQPSRVLRCGWISTIYPRSLFTCRTIYALLIALLKLYLSTTYNHIHPLITVSRSTLRFPLVGGCVAPPSRIVSIYVGAAAFAAATKYIHSLHRFI